MEISCVLSTTLWYPGYRHFYTCSILQCDLASSETFKFNLDFASSQKSSEDIQAVAILESKLHKIPNQLQNDFKNITILCVKQCTLSTINRNDISEFKQLIELWLPNNKLKSLPSDLFVDNAKLERISFSCNRIEQIGEDLLTPLVNLKFANFKRNSRIDIVFDIESTQVTLDKLKQTILDCDVSRKCNKAIQTDELKFQNDFNKFLYNENFKDFTIKGIKRTFKVHRFVMAARSSVICEMIEKNSNLNGISLTNVTDEVIEEILDYFYDDEMPKFANFSNSLMTYDLAMKMNLQDVTVKARKEIVKMIKKEKSVDVLEMALKHNDLDLMSIAFEIIKETFPKMKFKNNLLNDEIKVKKLIKELKNYWKNIDNTIIRFSSMNFFDNELEEFDESEKVKKVK